MTTFRCKRSGNTVSFENEDDIKQLRVHESYEEVRDENSSQEEAGPVAYQNAYEARTQMLISTPKKRGRPAKRK